MAIPLIIGKLQNNGIKKLISYAEKNKIDLKRMKNIMALKEPPVGDLKGYSLNIPVGFRVVYSIEEHPCGWMKHLSISLSKRHRVPNQYAVQMIMDKFSMGQLESKSKDLIYIEDVGNNIKAINVLDFYEG